MFLSSANSHICSTYSQLNVFSNMQNFGSAQSSACPLRPLRCFPFSLETRNKSLKPKILFAISNARRKRRSVREKYFVIYWIKSWHIRRMRAKRFRKDGCLVEHEVPNSNEIHFHLNHVPSVIAKSTRAQPNQMHIEIATQHRHKIE